jgi:hypothetical protein
VAEQRRRAAMAIGGRLERDRTGWAAARATFETSEAMNARLHSTSTAVAELGEPGVVCDPHRAPPGVVSVLGAAKRMPAWRSRRGANLRPTSGRWARHGAKAARSFFVTV